MKVSMEYYEEQLNNYVDDVNELNDKLNKKDIDKQILPDLVYGGMETAYISTLERDNIDEIKKYNRKFFRILRDTRRNFELVSHCIIVDFF